MPEPDWSDIDFAQSQVREDGLQFEHALGKAKTDVETAIIAVKQNSDALRFVPREVKISPAFYTKVRLWHSSSSDDDSPTHVSRFQESRKHARHTAR